MAVTIVAPTRRLTDEAYAEELADAVRGTTDVIGINVRYGS